jgi:hypothetical protein
MRTRILNTPGLPIDLWEWKWHDNTATPLVRDKVNHPYLPSGLLWATPALYSSFRSYMQDSTGVSGGFRPCFHTVERNEFQAPFIEHCFYRGWGGNAFAANLNSAQVSATHGLCAVPTYDESYLAEQALAFMMPKVRSNTSLVNSLLELKDLKHTNPFPSVNRILKKHPFLHQLHSKKGRKEFKKQLVTRLNNAGLNASFGIVPFVSDVVSVYDELTALSFKLAQLKKYADKPNVRHYRRVLPNPSGGAARSVWMYTTSGNTIAWPTGIISDCLSNGGSRPNITLIKRCRWVTRPVYHATLRYTYTLPKLDDSTAKVALALDALGVKLDPSIVWNAIPFTFLVDWVVDVGGFLGTFARDNYRIDVKIRDFTHSVKYHREAEIDATYPTDSSLFGTSRFINSGAPQKIGYCSLYRGSYRFYDRKSANPDVTSVQLRSPSLQQAALAGSLLLSRTSWGRAQGYQRAF